MSGQEPRIGPNMFLPRIQAPTFLKPRAAKSSSIPVVPPSDAKQGPLECACRDQPLVANPYGAYPSGAARGDARGHRTIDVSVGWAADILGRSATAICVRAGLTCCRASSGSSHPHSHAPYVAILCYSTIAIVLGADGSFAELVVLSTLFIAALYAAGCAASWVLARRGVALSRHASEPPLPRSCDRHRHQ